MQITRVNAVLYFTKTFFDFYAVGMSNTLRYTFPADVIQHLDIVTPENLTQQIQSFIQTNKLPSASILMLLADELLFCKELSLTPGVNPAHEEEIHTFLDAVPFEHVIDKLYKLEKKEILVATNLDYFTKFQEAFESNNSRIEEVVPTFLLGKTVNLQNGMPQDVAHSILDKLGNIRAWSMPIMQSITAPTIQETNPMERTPKEIDADASPTPPPTPKKSNKRILIMGISIIPLIGVFLFLLFQMNAENAKQDALFRAKQKSTQIQQPAPVPTVPVTSTTDQSTSAFAATVDEQNLKISIEYSPASASLAASMKNELTNFGIKAIQDIPVTTGSNANAVIFSDSISEGTKQRIVDELHKVVADIGVQSNSQMSDDVLITLP